MATYFIVIFIVFICCYLAEKSLIKNKISESGSVCVKKTINTKFFLFLVVATLTFVSGFRYYVGADYGGYMIIYDDIIKDGLGIFNLTEENGFRLLCLLCEKIYDSYTTMFVVCAIVTIVPFLYSTYKESNDFIFVSFMYIFSGGWHGSFNGMRQFFAATIIYLGRHYIEQRKFSKYFLICFIAFLFHRSSIFALLFYFICSKEFTLKKTFIILSATLILSYSYKPIFDFIGWLDQEEFVITYYASNSVNILRVLVHCCPAIIAIYLTFNKKLDKKHVFYTYMLIADAAIYIAMSGSAYLTRLGIYTSAFIPLGLSYITKATPVKYFKVLRYVIIILYFLFWLYDISINIDLNNFQFVFGK